MIVVTGPGTISPLQDLMGGAPLLTTLAVLDLRATSDQNPIFDVGEVSGNHSITLTSVLEMGYRYIRVGGNVMGSLLFFFRPITSRGTFMYSKMVSGF